MRSKRAEALRSQLTSRLIDTFNTAKSCSLDSATLNDQLNNLTTPYGKLPLWVKHYLWGYKECLYTHLHNNDLFHAYEWDGELYSNWDTMPEDLKEYIRKHNYDDVPSGIYWKHSQKLFFRGGTKRETQH